MNLFQFLFLLAISSTLFSIMLVQQENRLVQLKIQVPLVTEQLEKLQAETERMEMELFSFRSAKNLLRLWARPQYSHLVQPPQDQCVLLENCLIEESFLLQAEQ